MHRFNVWSEICCQQHSFLHLTDSRSIVVLTKKILIWELLLGDNDHKKINRTEKRFVWIFKFICDDGIWRLQELPSLLLHGLSAKCFLKTDSLLLALTPGRSPMPGSGAAQCPLPAVVMGHTLVVMACSANSEDPRSLGPTEPKYSQQPDILSLPLRHPLWEAFRLLKMYFSKSPEMKESKRHWQS